MCDYPDNKKAECGAADHQSCAATVAVPGVMVRAPRVRAFSGPNPNLPRFRFLTLTQCGDACPPNQPERTTMRGRLAREWPPTPPRRGTQSNGGRRTSSQPHQFQEASQPQHSRTNKLYFQAPSCVSPPKTPSVILFVTFSLFWARAAGSGELGVGDCYQAAGMPDRGFQAPLSPHGIRPWTVESVGLDGR